MSKAYEVNIITESGDTQLDIQRVLTTEVSRQATIAQQEYLAALVGGSVDEKCKKSMEEADCECDDPDDCECGDDDDDEDDDDEDGDLDEATFKKFDEESGRGYVMAVVGA